MAPGYREPYGAVARKGVVMTVTAGRRPSARAPRPGPGRRCHGASRIPIFTTDRPCVTCLPGVQFLGSGPLGDHLGEAGHVVGQVVQAWALGPQAGESWVSRASGWRISQPVTSRILGGDAVPGSGRCQRPWHPLAMLDYSG